MLEMLANAGFQGGALEPKKLLEMLANAGFQGGAIVLVGVAQILITRSTLIAWFVAA